jgi:TolA-binding protein
VRPEPDLREHPEQLLEQALRGELDQQNQAILERHLASCPDCAMELETERVFVASAVPGNGDEALDRAVIENALARLKQPEGLGNRLRRWRGARRLVRPVAALVVLGAVAAFALGLATRHARQTVPASVASSTPVRTLVLEDGSEVTANVGTTVQLVEQTPERTTVQLQSGAAQFLIRHNPRRVFRVDAGPIQIEDLGTAFGVDHQTGGSVHVVVFEGRVAVLSVASGVRVELGAGNDRVFPITTEASERRLAADEAPKAPEQATAQATAFAGAPHGQARSRSGEDPTALLLAADRARRSGNPQAAVAPLRRLIERYPNDLRTPAAAFTLGWVLLTDLARPHDAAAAFAEAERSSPRGPLAEDAAARVAEAWQKAGDPRRAAQAARHYEELYPSGRFLTLLRGLVGEH